MNIPQRSHDASAPAAPALRALVTGAGGGIGRVICQHLAEAGYAVAVNDLGNPEGAEETASLVRGAGREALVCIADVTNEQEVAEMFDRVEQSWGGLDLLVNNAGWESVEHAIEMPGDIFRRALDINLMGPFLCAQAAARLMESRGGVIINNLSIHDEVPRKGLSHYCSAKAGQRMLIKCLALEWAELGIRVNGVSPGAIQSKSSHGELDSDTREALLNAIPMGRMGSSEEVARIVVFLASDAASYVTGTTLVADGGYSLATVPYDPRPPRS